MVIGLCLFALLELKSVIPLGPVNGVPQSVAGIGLNLGRCGLTVERSLGEVYERLVAEPVATMEEVYERLGLGDFARVRPTLERQAEAMRKYRTNTYRHDPRLVAEISARCRGFLDRYGYAAPAVG